MKIHIVIWWNFILSTILSFRMFPLSSSIDPINHMNLWSLFIPNSAFGYSDILRKRRVHLDNSHWWFSLCSSNHWQVGQRVFYQIIFPIEVDVDTNKLWAQWYLDLCKGTNLKTIWHQRVELLEVLMETFWFWHSGLQLCDEGLT